MKQFFYIILFFLFMIPSSSALAYDYANTDAPFSVQFSEEWRQFTAEGIQSLSLKDQENLQSAFFKVDKKSFLYIKKRDASHSHYTAFSDAKNYTEQTPKEVFKEYRLSNPLETIAGKKITQYSYDFEQLSLLYETEKIRSGNTKYKIFGFWKMQEEFLWDFQIVTYDMSKKNKEEINLFLSSISFVPYEPTNIIPQEDHTKTFQTIEKEQTGMDSFLSFVLTKQFIYYLIGFIFFLLAGLLLNRIFVRN